MYVTSPSYSDCCFCSYWITYGKAYISNLFSYLLLSYYDVSFPLFIIILLAQALYYRLEQCRFRQLVLFWRKLLKNEPSTTSEGKAELEVLQSLDESDSDDSGDDSSDAFQSEIDCHLVTNKDSSSSDSEDDDSVRPLPATTASHSDQSSASSIPLRERRCGWGRGSGRRGGVGSRSERCNTGRCCRIRARWHSLELLFSRRWSSGRLHKQNDVWCLESIFQHLVLRAGSEYYHWRTAFPYKGKVSFHSVHS